MHPPEIPSEQTASIANMQQKTPMPDSPSTCAPSKLSDRGRELALAHFNHVEQQVSLAATTAGLIVAADALLLGGYISVTKDYKVFTKLGFDYPVALYILGGVFIVIGLLCALFAVFPNIKFASNKPAEHNAPKSVFFFGWVGKQTFTHYFKTFTDKDSNDGLELDRELLWQIWGKSCWLTKMFTCIQLAVGFTVLGTALTCLVVITLGQFFMTPAQ